MKLYEQYLFKSGRNIIKRKDISKLMINKLRLKIEKYDEIMNQIKQKIGKMENRKGELINKIGDRFPNTNNEVSSIKTLYSKKIGKQRDKLYQISDLKLNAEKEIKILHSLL